MFIKNKIKNKSIVNYRESVLIEINDQIFFDNKILILHSVVLQND